MFEALEKHQLVVDNTREAKEVLALTLGGLRSEEGHKLLVKLANAIGGDVRKVYVTSLALSVVGPPEILSPEEAEIRARFAGRPEDAQGIIRGQQSLLRKQPGVLSRPLAWLGLERLSTDELRSIKSMLGSWLKSAVISFALSANMDETLTRLEFSVE